MNVLYCTPESPLLPGGGIGTYVEYAAASMKAAGHRVHLMTWKRPDQSLTGVTAPFDAQDTRVVEIAPEKVWEMFPAGPWSTALSQILRPEIERCVDDWDIDVVETSDYLFPAYAFFQAARTSRRYRHVVLSTFNHGLNAEAYRANQMFPDVASQHDLCSERQTLRLSDVLLCPTRYASEVARSYGIKTQAVVTAEPYEFRRMDSSPDFSGRLVFLGRVSYAKGLDNLACVINQTYKRFDFREVLLIGSPCETTFRRRDAVDYFENRLKLSGKAIPIVITGSVPRGHALSMLSPNDIMASLSRAETFSYSTVEGIDAGMFPLCQEGTAMAEFFPAAMHRYLLPRDLTDTRTVNQVFDTVLPRKAAIISELQEFNRERCSPGRFAARVGDAYDSVRAAKRVRTSSRKTRITTSILIPAFNPSPIEFFETIVSIANQTVRPDEVIIGDDGSTRSLAHFAEKATSLGLNTTVIRHENKGLLGTRNALIDACRTDYAMFLDCDDLLEPRALELLLEAVEVAGKPDAVIPQRQNFGDSRERVIRHFLGDHLHFVFNDYRMTALIRSEVLRSVRFDAMVRNGEGDDWVFWLAFSIDGHRAEFLNEPVFKYRFYEGSMSWPWSMGQAAGTAEVLAEIIEKAAAHPDWKKLVARAFYAYRGHTHYA